MRTAASGFYLKGADRRGLQWDYPSWASLFAQTGVKKTHKTANVGECDYFCDKLCYPGEG